MLLRIAVVLSAVAFAVPALAEPLSAEAARRFRRQQFSLTCFEGTIGSCRIFSDGSVAGMLRIQVPPGALHAHAGGHAVRQGRDGLLPGERRVLQPVFQSNNKNRELPRRGVELRLRRLRFHPRARARNDCRDGTSPDEKLRCRARFAAP